MHKLHKSNFLRRVVWNPDFFEQLKKMMISMVNLKMACTVLALIPQCPFRVITPRVIIETVHGAPASLSLDCNLVQCFKSRNTRIHTILMSHRLCREILREITDLHIFRIYFVFPPPLKAKNKKFES